MEQNGVSAFARVARFIALAAVAVGIGAASLHAQASTGKIEGRVRDQAGAPLQSAQVVVEGTAFSALTNAQGYYFINNIPAGTITLVSRFVGYKGTRVAGLKVPSGQTITQDIQLESSPVVLDVVTTVAATNELVPRDEVTTKQRITGDFSERLPVDRIDQVLRLQPGVTVDNNNVLSIRGGRPDEAATYIDGVPVQQGNRGGGQLTITGSTVVVGVNAFEDASVTTGSSSAEFGNAQSGIISISTRTGSSTKFDTRLAFGTDEPFGKKTSLGINRVEASFGGPLAKGLTFFLSGQLQGQRSRGAGKGSEQFPLFTQAGVDTVVTVPSTTDSTRQITVSNYAVSRGNCDAFSGSTNAGIASNYGQACQGVRIPNSASSAYSGLARLNYSYGTGSKISITGIRSQDVAQIFTYNDLYVPGRRFGNQSLSSFGTLNWTQNLSKSSERALALDSYVSYQRDRFTQAPLAGNPQAGTLGFYLKGYPFLISADNFPVDTALINNYVRNAPGTVRSPYNVENTDQYQPVDEFRNNAYGIVGFVESGQPTGSTTSLQLQDEKRLIVKSNLDWQFDRYNRLKIGGEYTHYDTRDYTVFLGSTLAFSDAYIEKPIRWNGFVEDRLDLGDVVLVGGLRYDRFSSRALRPADNFPVLSTRPGFDLANPTALLVQDKAHSYLSPHVQVSFPVTDRTNFRLSYSHQVQTPDFGLLFQGINTDVNVSNTNQAFGTDLDFSKTITFEFGVRHAFSDDMVIDVAAYNKDVLSNQAIRLVSLENPLRPGTFQNIRLLTNADFGNTRGVDVRIDRRFGSLFNGTIAYTYQAAKNTGTDPFTFNAFGSRVVNALSPTGNQPPPQAIAPTSISRPHTLAGSFALNFPSDWKKGTALGALLGNFGVFATFQYQSGTAYTLCDPTNSNTIRILASSGNCGDAAFSTGLNTERLPALKSLDMRFTKGFKVGSLDLTAVLDARNILNITNIVDVFVATADTRNNADRDVYNAANLTRCASDAQASGIFNSTDKSIDLTFGGVGNQGCSAFSSDGKVNAADCIALIRTEQRYGNGDGVFTLAEQTTASTAAYAALNGRGAQSNFLTAGRRMRLGFEINF